MTEHLTREPQNVHQQQYKINDRNQFCTMCHAKVTVGMGGREYGHHVGCEFRPEFAEDERCPW